MKEIVLQTPATAGRIYVGDDAIKNRLPKLVKGQSNFVLTDDNVYAIYPNFFKEYFQDATVFVLPAGEENKSFRSLEKIITAMTGAGLLRTSRLFAVGGGVIGDIGGLCASLYMRGISCIQIPTTLLAQVDSSVGGKTAVDFNGVKNIIGAFYQPEEVLVAPSFLRTLPVREIKCGVGEIIKYCALNGEIFDVVEKNTDRITNEFFLTDLILSCIQHKANVVEADEKETGLRKSLNVGHTTGHAIELYYNLSHGESVLYGMLLETKIAIKKGVCDKEYGERLIKIIEKGLALAPKSAPDFSKISETAGLAKADKKNQKAGEITLAVAKQKNEWQTLTLSFDEYVEALREAVAGLTICK